MGVRVGELGGDGWKRKGLKGVRSRLHRRREGSRSGQKKQKKKKASTSPPGIIRGKRLGDTEGGSPGVPRDRSGGLELTTW